MAASQNLTIGEYGDLGMLGRRSSGLTSFPSGGTVEPVTTAGRVPLALVKIPNTAFEVEDRDPLGAEEVLDVLTAWVEVERGDYRVLDASLSDADFLSRLRESR